MLYDYDYYIDPDETEIFFGPMTRFEQEIQRQNIGLRSVKRSTKKSQPTNDEDDKENKSGNVERNSLIQGKKLSFENLNEKDDNETIECKEDVFDENGVETLAHNTTPCEIFENDLPSDFTDKNDVFTAVNSSGDFDRNIKESYVVNQGVELKVIEETCENDTDANITKREESDGGIGALIDQNVPSGTEIIMEGNVYNDRNKTLSLIVSEVENQVSVLESDTKSFGNDDQVEQNEEKGCHETLEDVQNLMRSSKFLEDEPKSGEIYGNTEGFATIGAKEPIDQNIKKCSDETLDMIQDIVEKCIKEAETKSVEIVEGNNEHTIDTKVQNIDGLDDLFNNCNLNESQVLWCSTDVNILLESLTGNMEDIDFDGEDEVRCSIEASSTPLPSPVVKRKLQQTPVCSFNVSGASSEHKHKPAIIPELVVTDATPVRSATATPTMKMSSMRKHAVRLVYKEDFIPDSTDGSKSSSSDSYKSCGSPHSTPFVKPTQQNIPKKTPAQPKSATRAYSDSKIRPAVQINRVTSSTSRIPTKLSRPTGAKPTSAAKSLQFSHVESPITKYIYQKSTPLVCNVQSNCSPKMQLTKQTKNEPKKVVEFTELPTASYRKGIPIVKEKGTDSRLPRLGPLQVKTIKPLSPKVVKHVARQNDVSILLSSEAKRVDHKYVTKH